MAGSKCALCGLKSACGDSNTSWLFFLIGLAATIAMRVIEPLRIVDPLYAKISWYVGVLGFLLFFAYKYKSMTKTSKLLKESGLLERIHSPSKISESDSILISEIICAQDNWKERVNYLVIFLLSGVALAFALWFDLLK